MDRSTQRTLLADAWRRASDELNFRAVVPFSFKGGDKTHDCVAFLPDFGGPHGMIVDAIFPPDFLIDDSLMQDAKSAGHYCSLINVESYGIYNSEHFQEALRDWGYFGAPENKPSWLDLEGGG